MEAAVTGQEAHVPLALDARAADALNRVLAFSSGEGYRGYNKHDGLNSPVLRLLLGWSKWPRLVAVQLVTRAPINIRPWLATPKTLNPKGLALFIQAYLRRYRALGQAADLREIERLIGLLGELRTAFPGSNQAWGYQYPWQDPGFYAPANTPNAVVTCHVCEALLEVVSVLGRVELLPWVASAIEFLKQDLPVLKDTPEELCLGYMPMPMTMRVMDVSILIGAVLARHDRVVGGNAHAVLARRLVNYVVQRQTPAGAWFYTDPPEASHITHDNYHTAFILDALRRYQLASGSSDFNDAYARGLAFYAARLFNQDGAPRWMHDRDYPHDIHGAANGIITLARHREDYPGRAAATLRWALDHMLHPAGRFYYQRTRWYTKRFTEMRWCNGWMSRALATWLYGEIDP
jgi:hypothetical protein